MPSNATPICSIDGCDGRAHARGLCQKHYKRLRKYGDVSFMRWQSVTPEMRFWEKVEKTDTCWFWKASGHPNPATDRSVG